MVTLIRTISPDESNRKAGERFIAFRKLVQRGNLIKKRLKFIGNVQA